VKKIEQLSSLSQKDNLQKFFLAEEPNRSSKRAVFSWIYQKLLQRVVFFKT